MGNLINSVCQVTNNSKKKVRVFVTEKALDIDTVIESYSSGGKKFVVGKDLKFVHVAPSQTQDVPWVSQHFLSAFLEDADDGNICSKVIIHNQALSVPVSVLLYEV